MEGRDSAKCACTILLRTKKIKKFYSFIHNDLAILTPSKIPIFRIKHAGSCKVWRAAIKAAQKDRAISRTAMAVEGRVAGCVYSGSSPDKKNAPDRMM